MSIYHINDLKKYLRCPRYYYLTKDSDQSLIPYLRNTENITELILEKYKIVDYFKGLRNDNNDCFFNNQNKYEWFVKTRFEYHGLRIKVPLMHKVGTDFYDIYYISMTLYPKSEEVSYYVYTQWVLDKLGIKINNIKIIHLNANYVRENKLDVDELFIETEHFYNSNKRKVKHIKDTIIEKTRDLDPLLYEMQELNIDDFEAVKTNRCYRRNKCEMYDQCFEKELDYPENSILTLVSSRNKNRMFKHGIKYLKDVDPEEIEGTKQQFAQIMADRLNGLYVDYLGLKMWFEKLNYFPITFIDFEWERFLIPPYEKLKPYDVLCFEYSVHILNKDGSLNHYSFVETGDCRLNFIEGLLKDVPENGPIVAFNAIGAEILRIKELAEQFPKYKERLLSLNERMVDLSIPFSKGFVYDTRMKGMYSVKILLNIISDKNYQDLNISDGMEAVYKWRSIDNDEADNQEVKNDLIEYCSLDTYSMVEIYWWLLRILNKS